MAVILWIIFKLTLRQRMVDQARRQAERGLVGSAHEAHGEMDMSISDGPFLTRLFSPRAFTAISHTFYMDVYAIYVDLGLGFLIAGALAAWVPNSWWQAFFLTDHPSLNEFWSPLIAPVISMLSFVCSVGNVPLAVVLWNGGISFGGVITFTIDGAGALNRFRHIVLPLVSPVILFNAVLSTIQCFQTFTSAFIMTGGGPNKATFFYNLYLYNQAFISLQMGMASAQAWILFLLVMVSTAFLLLMAVLAWRFITTGGFEMLRGHSHHPEAPGNVPSESEHMHHTG